jgi:syndecan 1
MRQDEDVTELCHEIFAGLPRRDQRQRGREYVRGLLHARGRKSIRNIAGMSTDPAAEQALHHFIADSTWSWMPVRRALKRYISSRSAIRSWVIHPMMIRKAGAHSVGVGRRFSASLQQSFNAQHAVGLWAATDHFATPVNWQLHLNNDWLTDKDRRRRAAIPDDAVPQTLDACAVDTYLELSDRDRTPVTVDAREMDAETVIRRLLAGGAAVLVRIPAGLRLAAGPGQDCEEAADLLAATRHDQRPVFGIQSDKPLLACTVPVRLRSTRRRDPLLLLGVGTIGQQQPGELWLTNLTDAGLADLVGLTRLSHGISDDLDVLGDQVGLRDFTGRSFSGWHRHTTLASAAYALLAARGTARPVLRRTS